MIDRKAIIGQPLRQSRVLSLSKGSGQAARPATSSGYVPSTTHHRRGFIPIREDGTGWLLFLYDPVRDIIEVQRRGRKQIIDLSQYKENDDEQAENRDG